MRRIHGPRCNLPTQWMDCAHGKSKTTELAGCRDAQVSIAQHVINISSIQAFVGYS